MCPSCDPRMLKLRELAEQFAALADETSDPGLRERLRRSAADLDAFAESGCATCALADVVWIEPADEPADDRLALET